MVRVGEVKYTDTSKSSITVTVGRVGGYSAMMLS